MQSPPIPRIQDNLMPSSDNELEVETALRMSAAALTLGTLYQDLMQRLVLNQAPMDLDRKQISKYKRILLDDETYYVLLIVWRESPYVTDECLRRSNLSRQFSQGTFTAYSLATQIASTASDLAKTNSRIRSISLAAEAYGLLERGNLRSTSKPLCGTLRLHRFFLTLSEQQFRILSELGPLLCSLNDDSRLSQQ